MAMLFSLFRPLIDFALPPRCAGCGQIVADDHQLCTPCWTSIDFLSGSGCERCGTPLPSTALVCAPCLATPPAHDGVRAAVSYGEIARKVVLNLKHGRRVGLAALAARAMERHLPSEPCMLVPVPLHRWRIWGRGFNQSALIAKHLAANSMHDLALDHLRRTKSTPMLRNLGANRRRLAMRGVFDINPHFQNTFKGKSIILVDDVYTSGATANACARVLKRAGATHVIVLCWARVLIGD
jgi:ComF family protein